jgi:hypothetical protein
MKTPPGTRDLVLVATLVVGLSRFVDGPLAWAIALLLLVGVMFGALEVIGDADPAAQTAGVPIEAVLVPALAAVAGLGVLRLAPIGLLLLPVLAAIAWLLQLTLATETRLASASAPPSSSDRNSVLVQGLVAAFGAFIGINALVAGPTTDPATAAALAMVPSGVGLPAIADGVVGFLLGYRVAALRSSNLRDVASSAAATAAVVAIAAAVLRAIEIPGLLGPALLVLVFFLWDAIHIGAPTRRRDPRRTWETALLVVLGVVVVIWSLGLRG